MKQGFGFLAKVLKASGGVNSQNGPPVARISKCLRVEAKCQIPIANLCRGIVTDYIYHIYIHNIHMHRS